jgi:hypothetical protein
MLNVKKKFCLFLDLLARSEDARKVQVVKQIRKIRQKY